jgi:hypothetical protein
VEGADTPGALPRLRGRGERSDNLFARPSCAYALYLTIAQDAVVTLVNEMPCSPRPRKRGSAPRFRPDWPVQGQELAF